MFELQSFSTAEEMSEEEADPFSSERIASREIINEIADIVTEKASTGTRFYTRSLKSFRGDGDIGQVLLSSYELDSEYPPSRWYHKEEQYYRAPSQGGTSDLLAALPRKRLVGVEILKYGDTDDEGDQERTREEYVVEYDESEEDFRLRHYSRCDEDEESFVDLSHGEAQEILRLIKDVCS